MVSSNFESTETIHRHHHHNQSATQESSATNNYSKIASETPSPKIGPIYLIGYLGSAILTKGKTGLGCLQMPIRDLYISFRQNTSRLFQERRLVISSDGLSLLYNENGMERVIHNELSSVNDVQLLKVDYEKRRDKKIHCGFVPYLEEITDSRYSNLYSPLEKHHVSAIENLAHPPVIALVMRRSTGIQALECHVLIARSTIEAKSIVSSIQNVCNKHKFEQTQVTNVFQYQPFADEQNIDVITDRNTSSNAVSVNKRVVVEKEVAASSSSSAAANGVNSKSAIFSKSETNFESKQQNGTTLFNRLRANLRDSSRKRTKDDKEMPPLPRSKSSAKKEEKSSDEKRDSKRKFNKIFNTSFSSSQKSLNKAGTSYPKNSKDSSQDRHIPVEISTSPSKQQLHSTSTRQLAQPSVTSIGSFDAKFETIKKEKKQSIGKRLLSSLNSNKPVKNILSSKSTTSIQANSSSKIIDQQNVADIDFRKSRTSIIDDNLLIDGHTIFPMVLAAKPPVASVKCNQNFILKSRHSPQPTFPAYSAASTSSLNRSRSHLHNEYANTQQQQQARMSSYLSTPSLVQDVRSPSSSIFSYSYQNLNRQQQQQQLLQKPPPVRSQSVVSIHRNDSPRLVYSTDAALLDISRKSFSNTETPRQHNIPPKRALTPEMFANHLVWNKNSKSAESLDVKKFNSSSSNLVHRQHQQPQYRSRSNFESDSLVARAVSPGHHLSRNSDEFRSRSGQFEYNSRQYKEQEVTRDFQYNYIKDNKIGANINSIINSNSHLPAASFSYTPISSGNAGKLRSYSPILSAINKASFERNQANSNSNVFKSYVTVTSDGPPQVYTGKDHLVNDYSRLNANNSRFTNSSEFLSQVSRSNTESESNKILSSKVDYFANANDQVHLKSYEERFNEQKRKEEMEKRIVGGIKVYPTIPRDHKQAEIIRQVNKLKELENEYNFIESDKTFSKEEAYKIDRKQDYRNEYVLNKLTNQLNLDENLNLDHEIIDLTKNTPKREVEAVNVPIDIPIYLQTSSRRGSSEYQQGTRFVGLDSHFSKPRIVSTKFVTPVNSGNLSNLPKNSAFIKENANEPDKKPRFIYYYDDESFGGY